MMHQRPMTKKRSFLVSVKSRDQLLRDDKLQDEHLLKIRRTKIIASISDKTNSYEKIKEMYLAGANGLNFNTAYSHTKDAMKNLAQTRDRLEAEFGKYIPINIMLKGRQIRVGNLREPEIYVKKGQTIRLTQDGRVLGDNHIVPIDDEHFFDQVTKHDIVILDYGQVALKIEYTEDSEQQDYFLYFSHYNRAQNQLMEDYPDLYPCSRQFRKAFDVDSVQHSSDSENKSHSLISGNTHEDLRVVEDANTINSQQDDSPHYQLTPQSNLQKKKNKFAEALKKQKAIKHQKKFKILVCTVQSDCIIKPLRPVFIMKNGGDAIEPFEFRKNKQSYSNLAQLDQERIMEQGEDRDSSDESEEEESQITTQDIIHIKNAKKLGFDSITISNVHKVNDIRELRQILGKDCRMRVLVRITTKEAIENFEAMLNEADGCIIARGYISAQQAIEGVFQSQINMIKKAHTQLKPV